MGGKTDANVEALDVLLYDGSRMHLARPGRRAGNRADRAGRRAHAEKSTLSFAHCATSTPTKSAADFRRFPAASRAISSIICCRKTASTSPKLWWEPKATCVMVLEATLRSAPESARPLAAGARLSGRLRSGRSVLEMLAAEPIGLEGIDDRLVQDMIRSKAFDPKPICSCFPMATGWLLVEFGGDEKPESDDQAQR